MPRKDIISYNQARHQRKIGPNNVVYVDKGLGDHWASLQGGLLSSTSTIQTQSHATFGNWQWQQQISLGQENNISSHMLNG